MVVEGQAEEGIHTVVAKLPRGAFAALVEISIVDLILIVYVVARFSSVTLRAALITDLILLAMFWISHAAFLRAAKTAGSLPSRTGFTPVGLATAVVLAAILVTTAAVWVLFVLERR
jgi:hypothetical protein